jgi:hypothetical protein
MRKWMFRLGTVLVLIAIAACMMVIGRGHTVYFDNKKLDYQGQTYDTYRRINVFVNGEQVAKLSAKDRGMASFMGQSFSFDLEITKEKGDDPVTNTYHIKVPYGRDGTVLNLPGMLAGLPEEAYTSEFVPVEPEPSAEDEEIVTEDFGIGESEEESQP